MIMLDKRYGLYIDTEYRNFTLIDTHPGDIIQEFHKLTGKKNKNAGQPVPDEKIGYFRDLEPLLKRYAYELVKRSKKKVETIEALINIYVDVFERFKDLSFHVVKTAIDESKK